MSDQQQAGSTPTYVVYRDTHPAEPFDPTSPLLFFPPKGSDELFDALRVAFPHVKSHAERMREAVIAYLLEERQEDHPQQPSPTLMMDPLACTVSSGAAPPVWSSPETFETSTPASYAPSPQVRQLTRQPSAASSQSSPPAIDQMTSVFSLSASTQPKQRVRRKMTEAEKIEYRKRRIVKACDKCAKRKRKCPHNQAEMETLKSKTSTKIGSRVQKSASPGSSKSASPPCTDHHEPTLDPAILLSEDMDLTTSFDLNDFVPFEDFDLFPDSFSEFDMNAIPSYDQSKSTNTYPSNDFFTPEVSPMQHSLHFGEYDDFTLLDPMISSAPDMEGVCGTQHSPRNLAMQDWFSRRWQLQEAFAHASNASMSIDSSLSSLPDSISTDNGRLEEMQRTGGDTNSSSGSGHSSPRETLRTSEPAKEKPVPTHTAHVHDAECGDLSGLDDIISRPQEPTGRSSSHMIPNLTGTTEATSTSTSLLEDRTRSPAVTMEHTLSAVRSDGILNHLSQHTDGIVHDQASSRPSAHQQPPLCHMISIYDGYIHESSTSDSGPQWHGRDSRSRASLAGISGQELASTSVPVPDGYQSAAPQGRPLPLSMTMAIERDAAPQADQAHPLSGSRTRGDESGKPSLGEGLPENADPAYQLYMTRKRIGSIHATSLGGTPNARFGRSTQAVAGSAPVQAWSADGLPGHGLATKTHLETATPQGMPGLEVGSPRSLPTKQPVAGPSSANGGAYLRPEDVATPVIAASPALASDNNQHRGGQAGLSVNAATLQQSTPTAPAKATLLASLVPAEERLSDHVRYRDHHGRFGLLSALFAGVLLVLMASTLSSTTVPSLLLLAVLAPTPCNSSRKSPGLQTIVQCTAKNSSWLSAFASRLSGFVLGMPERGDEAVAKMSRAASVVETR